MGNNGMESMKRLLSVGAVLLALTGFGARERGYADVRLRGWLGERLERLIENHVAKTDVDYLTAPFAVKDEREENWQTEFWGKYMHSAVPFARYAECGAMRASRPTSLVENIERGVDAIIASQEADGYIGNYPPELRCGSGWDVWGMKYTMMGLLHYADAFPDTERAKRAMDAACRLCDYLIAQLGPGGKCGRPVYKSGFWSGLASSSVLEPVVWLYRRTGNARYLDFAKSMVADMCDAEDGPRLVDLAMKGISPADRNGYGNAKEHGADDLEMSDRRKAYEMMSCYQGLLEYVEVMRRVGDNAPYQGGRSRLADILAAAEATVGQIIRDEINLAGGAAAGEMWYHGARKQHLPYIHQQETCVIITWMRLLAKLTEITGKSRYADELEKTFYNAYLASLNLPCDEFAAYTPLNGSRSRGHRHCKMHTNCCNANGPRGFLTFLRSMVRANDDSAIMDFYASATEKVSISAIGKDVWFEVYTYYPKEDAVTVTCKTAGSYALTLRIPAWSEKAEVSVNGKGVEPNPVAGSYLSLRREWKEGDVVELKFDMKTRVHRLDHFIAFTRGPILLARDTRFCDGPLDEPLRRGKVADGASAPVFVPVQSYTEDMWMVFETTLPLGLHWVGENGKLPLSVRFCDYASAANTWSPENACRVWLPEEYGRNE